MADERAMEVRLTRIESRLDSIDARMRLLEDVPLDHSGRIRQLEQSSPRQR